MKALLAALFLLLAAAPATAQAVVLDANTIIDWSGGPHEYAYGGFALDVSLEGPEDGERMAILRIAHEGMKPIRVADLTSGTGWGKIGIVEFAPGVPTVVFGVYSGGAHCCTTLTAITPVDGQLVAATIDTVDTDIVEPSDIDGDGTFELDLPDDRFNYEFDGFAGSVPARIVYTVREGNVVDASTDPRYAPLYERELAEWHAQCSGPGEWSYASCAAMLASAARLGRFDEFYVPMADALRSGAATGTGWGDFIACPDAACAETITTTSFADAVVLRLAEWGYVDWATAVNHAGFPKG